MARTRAHLRTAVLNDLAAAKRAINRLQTTWKVPATAYDTDSRDGRGNVPQRPRRDDEYPENRPADWAQLYNETDALIKELVRVRESARVEWITTLPNLPLNATREGERA